MSELANKGIDIGRIMEKAHNFCPHDLSHLNKMRWMAQDFVKNYQIAPTDDAAYKEVGSFLYGGGCYVATSSDDPRGIKLYRPAPTDSSAAPSDAIDLATAILSLRVKNPHEEDNCGLWTMGFRYAQTTIATMVAAQPVPVSAQVSERESTCRACHPPEFPSYCATSIEGDMVPADLWDYACMVGWRCGNFPVAAPVAVASSPAGGSIDSPELSRILSGMAEATLYNNGEYRALRVKLVAYIAALATRQPEDGATKEASVQGVPESKGGAR